MLFPRQFAFSVAGLTFSAKVCDVSETWGEGRS